MSEDSIPAGGPGPRRHAGWAWFALRWTWRAAIVASIVAFVRQFDPNPVQWKVDGLLLLAIALWCVEVWDQNDGPLIRMRPRRADVLPFLLILLVFVPAWLPFMKNWRWAYTGDSVALFVVDQATARHGLQHNLLSVKGVDENFTYLFTVAYGALMYVFEPTLAWHRIMQLVVACVSLAFVYSYYTIILNRFWASAILAFMITNYLWLWFTYVSYGKIDSHIWSYATLLLGLWIWRNPDRLSLWMWCGLVGGVTLYWTQTAWTEVAAVNSVIGIYALVTKRFRAAAVLVISFLLPAIPLILQWDGVMKMTMRQAKSVFDRAYLWSTFKQIVLMPYWSMYNTMGIQGAVLRRPLGTTYLVGGVIGLLSLVPAIRRRLRLPPAVTALTLLLAFSILLMTLTNNGYEKPSTKRTYHLVPLQVFFALLPAYLLSQWLPRKAWATALVTALVLAAFGAYVQETYMLVRYPAWRVYGVNVFDGLIELRQTVPERRVTLFTSRPWLVKALSPADAFYNEEYHLNDTVEVKTDLRAEPWSADCLAGRIVCYEPNFDERVIGPIVRGMGARIVPYPLLNSTEMRCLQCPSPAKG